MVHIGQFDLSIEPGIVAVIDADPVNRAKRALSMGAHILELRVDLLGIRDAEELEFLLKELKIRFQLPIIVTNRCHEEGGYWDGSEDERINLLISAIPYSDALDVELSTSCDSKVIGAVRSSDKTLIISSHDFTSTPPYNDMVVTLDKARDAGADIVKLAVTPNSSVDTLNLLKLTLETVFPVCTIAMGKLGSHTRVIAPIYGSVLTYGSVDNAVAPGQLKINELRHIMEVFI